MTGADHDARRRMFRDVLESHGVDRCVIVTGTFRAGTSFVCSLLGKNGMTGIRMERFSKLAPLVKGATVEVLRDQLDRIFASATEGLFVTKIMWPQRNSLAAVLGFERKDSAGLAAMFPRARWINVHRRDKFGQAISFWKAKKTNQWQSPKNVQAAPEPEYDFDGIRACFVELCAHELLWQDFHSVAGTELQQIIYEDFVDRVEADLPHLLSWLDNHRLNTSPISNVSPLKQQRNAHSEEIRRRFLEDFYREPKFRSVHEA
jgi:LPS sulfotransferase NodH